MKRIFIMIGLTSFAATAILAATASGGADFDRYRVILDRKPFGEITPADTSATIAETSAPTEALTRELELKAIIDSGNAPLRAGFLDKKTTKTFYLEVGEKNETYELVSADYDNEEAVLRRGVETTIFNLKPSKTNASPDGPLSAPDAPPGFTPFSAPGAMTTRGFTTVPNANTKNPFFSDMKKRKFSPFKPMGTNMPAPFQSQSLENFMKPNTNASPGFPGQLRPFGSLNTNHSAGDTIDNFLRVNPDAAHKFSPFKPPDPNAGNTENTGNNAQGFIMQDSDQPLQVPNFFSAPAPEDEGEVEE